MPKSNKTKIYCSGFIGIDERHGSPTDPEIVLKIIN